MNSSLTVEEHFAFGENWQSFTRVLDEQRLAAAESGLRRLIADDELVGASFLDIGCGSGLSSLAALRLGAAKVDATDIDPASVAATRETLTRFASNAKWSARVVSVFDLPASSGGGYDVVYSWGVLHHTGAMWRAVECAAAQVKPGGGLLAIALYRKTPWCRFWTREKRFYSRAPRFVQAVLQSVFHALTVVRLWKNGYNVRAYFHDYSTRRGMDWSHDVHDWLGGYPYESASVEEVHDALAKLGFEVVHEFVHPPGKGYLGTGCDEYVARRVSAIAKART